jgi:hypothetical protein
MNRHDAVLILSVFGIVAAIGAIKSSDPSWIAMSIFLVLTALLVEMFGPATESEKAYRRSHQARKGTRR